MLEVLVVDDEPDICWALKMGLGDEEIQITHVQRGEDALRQVGQHRFDAAIIDIKLPGKNGIEIARAIRQLVPRLPILMISGYHYKEDQLILDGMRKEVFQGFIAKPFELHHVTTLLKRVIREGGKSPSSVSEGQNERR